MTIRIEKNVPMSSSANVRGKKYPLDEMKCGDSFVVPTDVEIASFRSYVTQYSRPRNKKFTVRKIIDKGVTTYRCWRIK